jgi:uracil-DNA glycosylase family 4
MRNPNCQNCELHKGAETICLWGEGPKKARVMVVGEAPGASEDKEGRPFVGASGKVLREELARVGVSPEEVYITNTVKCRPPDNAKPKAGQIKACKQYLDAEIESVKPEYIITLGAVPTKLLLKKAKITEVHGQVIEMPNFKGMACFHPAYTLYDPSKLPVLKKDFQRIANEINGVKQKKAIFKWRLINDENLSEFFEDLDNCEWFSFDTETSSLDWFKPGEYLSCLNMSFDNGGGTWVLPLQMPFSPYLNKLKRQHFIIKMIADRLRRKKKKGVAHNGKYDNHWLDALYGVTFPLDFDTMLASHCIDENRSHGLDQLATLYLDAPYYDIPLNWKQGKFKPNECNETNVRTMYRYGGKDAFYTLQLRPLMERELAADRPTHRLFYRLVMRAARAMHRVEGNGLYILMDRFRAMRKQVVKERDEALKELNRMAGKLEIAPGIKRAVNWNSPQQVAQLLFGKLGLPVIEKTDGGAPSTGEATLVALKDKHPVANQLVKYRELDKFLGTYLDGWKALMHEDRVYFSYKIHGTVTGRWSSRLHQTPRDGKIRNLVSAPDGWTFVQGDFSQAELRVAAILSGDLELLHCFKNGIDAHWRTLLHTIQVGGVGEYVKPMLKTAAKLAGRKVQFNEAVELLQKAGHEKCIEIWDGWKEARKKAKAINFGFVYGMREKKFIETCKLKYGFEPTEDEAAVVRRAYFSLYRGLEPWHNRAKKLVKLDGYVRSLSGRMRRLPGISSSDRALRAECERQAINSPVQGYIGDHKAMALVELEETLDWNRSRVVGEHHDAILFWVRTKYLTEELPKIAKIMQNPSLLKELKIELPVPIEVELEYGPWGQKGNTKWTEVSVSR